MSSVAAVTLWWAWSRIGRHRGFGALRSFDRPCAAVTGGLIAGLILGPGGLGVFAPGLHGALFEDGFKATQAVHELEREQLAAQSALTQSGVSPEAITELEQQQDVAIQSLQSDADQARRTHATLHASAWLSLVCGAVFSAASFGGRRSTPPSPGGLFSTGDLADWSRSLGAFCFAALPTAVLAQRMLDASLVGSMVIGAVVAGGSIGPALRRVRGDVQGTFAQSTGPMLLLSVASLGLLGVASRVMDAGSEDALRGGALGGDVVIACLALAWLLGRASRAGISRATGNFGRSRLGRVARWMMLWLVWPAIACGLMVRADIGRGLLQSNQGAFSPWFGAIGFVAAGALLAGGGHAIGAWFGDQVAAARPRGFFESVAAWVDAHAHGVGRFQALLGLSMIVAGLIDPAQPWGAAAVLAIGAQAAASEALGPAWRRRELIRP